MASHEETFGPRRQPMTVPVATGTRTRFLAETDAPLFGGMDGALGW